MLVKKNVIANVISFTELIVNILLKDYCKVTISIIKVSHFIHVHISVYWKVVKFIYNQDNWKYVSLQTHFCEIIVVLHIYQGKEVIVSQKFKTKTFVLNFTNFHKYIENRWEETRMDSILTRCSLRCLLDCSKVIFECYHQRQNTKHNNLVTILLLGRSLAISNPTF